MIRSLEKKFIWQDIIEDGQCKGWGWSQTCILLEDEVDINCLWTPTLLVSKRMNLHIAAARHVVLIEYIDTGFVLYEYVARLPFKSMLTRLRDVQATPVHLAASELLGNLEKDGLLIPLSVEHGKHRS